MVIDDVCQAPCAVGKEIQKARAARRSSGRTFIRRNLVSDLPRKFLHRAERVEPERLDLDRFALPGRDGAAVDPRIHPRERLAGRAPLEEAVFIHADAVARAPDVPRDDVGEDGVEALDEGDVTRGRHMGPDGLEVPERRVDGVVLGGLVSSARVRKPVGQHALAHVPGELEEDVPRDRGTTRRERKARQGDHRVAAPVREPRVAGDDAAPAPPGDQEPVRGARERADKGIGRGVSGELLAAGELVLS